MNDKIGALWIKTSVKGDFFSGNIEVDGKKIAIVCFKNTLKKEGEKTPDYNILISKPREEKRDMESLGMVKDGIPF